MRTRPNWGEDPIEWQPIPIIGDLEGVKTLDSDDLVGDLVRGIGQSNLGSILLLVCNGFGEIWRSGVVCFYFLTAIMIMFL